MNFRQANKILHKAIDGRYVRHDSFVKAMRKLFGDKWKPAAKFASWIGTSELRWTVLYTIAEMNKLISQMDAFKAPGS